MQYFEISELATLCLVTIFFALTHLFTFIIYPSKDGILKYALCVFVFCELLKISVCQFKPDRLETIKGTIIF